MQDIACKIIAQPLLWNCLLHRIIAQYTQRPAEPIMDECVRNRLALPLRSGGKVYGVIWTARCLWGPLEIGRSVRWLGRRFTSLLAASLIIAHAAMPAWSQDSCLPPRDTNYIKFDSSGFIMRKTPVFSGTENVDFEIPACDDRADGHYCLTTFAVESLKVEGALIKVQVHVDDELLWVGIPLSRIGEVRFVRTNDEMVSWHPNWVEDNLAGALACAMPQRRARAQGIFGRAFELLQKREYRLAEDLFSEGLVLDPTSAIAAFYYAEAKRLGGHEDGIMLTYYERANQLGAPPEIAGQVIEQINRYRSR